MLLQITLAFLLMSTVLVATPPPGYQKKDAQSNKNVPKYNYGYKIAGEKGSQEKQEQRDGIYALGRYYVQGVGSSQTVEYLADDWGFHPFIEYSNVGPHSKSSTQIAFGEEAVKALRFSQKNYDSPQTLGSQNLDGQRSSKILNGQGLNIFLQRQPNLVYHNLPEKLIQQQQQQYIFFPSIPQASAKNQQNLIYNVQPKDRGVQRGQEEQKIIHQNNAYQSIPPQNYQEIQSFTYSTPGSSPQVFQQQKLQERPIQNIAIQKDIEQQKEEVSIKEEMVSPQVTLQEEQNTYQNVAQEENTFILTQSNQMQPNIGYQNIQQSTSHEQKGAKAQAPSQASFQILPATQQTVIYQLEASPDLNEQGSIYQNEQKLQEIQKTFSQQRPTDLYSNIYQGTKQTSQQEQAKVFEIKDAQSHKNVATVLPNSYAKNYNHNQANVSKNKEREYLNQYFIQTTPQLVQSEQTKIIRGDEKSNQSENSNANYYLSKVKTIDDYSQDSAKSHIDKEEVYPNPGLYGTKINSKSEEKGQYGNVKLLTNPQKLVTGQDVLNINDVFNQGLESSTIAAEQDYTQESVTNTNTESTIYSTTHSPITESIVENNEASLTKDPIVVADLEENNLNLKENREHFYSTTQNTVETMKTVNGFETTEPTVVVTPRPVGSNFLAPITAGVQLQSVEESFENKVKATVVVDIQKSVPYYLGKLEYFQDQNKYSKNEEGRKVKPTPQKVTQSNVELGTSVLQYGLESLPTPENFVQNPANNLDGSNYQSENPKQESKTHQYQNLAANTYQSVDQNQESGQVQYQIQAPYQQVLIPEYQQIVFQQGTTHNYKIVPQVQIFDYQIQKEPENHFQQKQVDHDQKEATKYDDRPYPIENLVSEPYLVEVTQHVDKNVKKVNPTPFQESVPRTYVPVEITKPYPIDVGKLVRQSYPVTIAQSGKVPVQHQTPVEVPKYIDRPYPVYVNQDNYKNPYAYAPNYQINCDNFKFQNVKNLGYLPPADNSIYHKIHINDYIGLKPPRERQNQYKSIQSQTVNINNNDNNSLKKNRNARHSFGQELRIEYGFMPPLIPSLEIDENGKPIEKNEQ